MQLQTVSLGSNTDITKLRRSEFGTYLLKKSSKKVITSEKCRNKNINKHNNFGNPLTSRRTDAGKIVTQGWVSLQISQNLAGIWVLLIKEAGSRSIPSYQK